MATKKRVRKDEGARPSNSCSRCGRQMSNGETKICLLCRKQKKQERQWGEIVWD